ncbi:MAG: TatD family hydrolase [bacterium]
MLVDSHAHLDMPQFEEDLPEVLERARQAGVEAVVSCATSLKSSKKALEIAQRFPGVFAAVGIHPHDAQECSEEALAMLSSMASHPRVVAIGEMGLDFYRNLCPQEVQIQAFRKQIRLARDLGKPLVVHDREAHGLVLRILQEERAQEVGGVLHCFSGDSSMAKRCLEMGMYLSIPGSVTFRNATLLRSVLSCIPLERMLLETDSPFLAPVPFRGKRNEPSYLRYTAERVARTLRKTPEEVARCTRKNALELFGLEKADVLNPKPKLLA